MAEAHAHSNPSERYFVPHSSRWPIVASLALFVTMFGFATMLNEASFGKPVFYVGLAFLAIVMFKWFADVVGESVRGFYNRQVDTSFRMGMIWFIFSEIMFFIAFFGALFYVRYWSGPWLGGEGAKGIANMLWPNFEYTWPMLNTPDPKLYPAPKDVIDPWHLPLINTILLISSSVTVTLAHHALRHGKRAALKGWLGLTILLGACFLTLQVIEYVEAYHDLGLTLGSGIYGATFFMLTGFHGAHVTIGTIILAVMLLRIMKGHLDEKQHFGFEAASWYWHFVDVVWVGLFIFVYVL